MYCTYILKSRKVSKTYIGYTEDVNKRIFEHNSGKVKFTKTYRPWEVVYLEEHPTRSQAMNREKYFKSRSGRRWMKQNLF